MDWNTGRSLGFASGSRVLGFEDSRLAADRHLENYLQPHCARPSGNQRDKKNC